MKKCIVLATSVLLVFALLLSTGCSKEKTDTSSDGTPSGLSVDSDGNLINSDGEIVNSDGTIINSDGYIVNSDGSIIAQTGSQGKSQISGQSGGGGQSGGASTVVQSSAVIDDELDDWSKVFEHGKQFVIDTSWAYVFDNDGSRIIAGSSYAKDCWFTYKCEYVSEFEIVSYRARYESKSKEGMQTLGLFVSTDNKAWTEIKVSPKTAAINDDWEKAVYSKKDVDKKYKYFKIVVPPTSGTSSHNVGRVRINDIASMYSPLRFRENRAAATFYVDSVAGSDNNDGMSAAKAFKSLYKVSQKYFQPGDSLLFKSGATFSGSLTLKGDGTAAQPIKVGSYGSGAKPIIKARGENAVTVKAVHISIENLQITNPNGVLGMYVMAFLPGENKNISIKNCDFFDINTGKTNMEFATGAIHVMASGLDPAWFDGFTIENNTMKNVSRCGLWFTTQWANRPGGWGFNTYKSDTDGWYPAKNVVVRGNKLDNIGGDGLVIHGALAPLMERNTVYRFYNCTAAQHSGSAGIWVHSTNDAVIQYNEVGYGYLKAGQIDGEAFNIDIGNKNTTVQYNYSHNNTAGFLLMCNIKEAVSTGHTVRYNVSINDYDDYTYNFGFPGIFMITGDIKNSKIYNNTIYTSSKNNNTFKVKPVLASNFNEGGLISGFTFENNLFHAADKTDVSWTLENSGNLRFANNIYSGNCPVPNANGVTDSAPKKTNISFKAAVAYTGLDGRDTALKLTPTNAPAGATSVSGNGGKDYNGNAITKTFYGAIQP